MVTLPTNNITPLICEKLVFGRNRPGDNVACNHRQKGRMCPKFLDIIRQLFAMQEDQNADVHMIDEIACGPKYARCKIAP